MLISALPRRPTDYAALPASFGPRPRTVKMVSRPAGSSLVTQSHGILTGLVSLTCIGCLPSESRVLLQYPFSVQLCR